MTGRKHMTIEILRRKSAVVSARARHLTSELFRTRADGDGRGACDGWEQDCALTSGSDCARDTTFVFPRPPYPFFFWGGGDTFSSIMNTPHKTCWKIKENCVHYENTCATFLMYVLFPFFIWFLTTRHYLSIFSCLTKRIF